MAIENVRPFPGPQENFLKCPARECLFGGAGGGGKLLRLDEPIPTPSGWTTMGDLRPGDIVFDAEGQPTRVTWCSEIEEHPDAWELEFDDGSTIQADAGHQWVTLTDAERRRRERSDEAWRERRRATRPSRALGRRSAAFVEAITRRNRSSSALRAAVPTARGAVRTTREIVDSLHDCRGRGHNHSILNPGPLQLPQAELPIDPYVLGAWLGDGTSNAGYITSADDEVIAWIVRAGWEPVKLRAKYLWGFEGLTTALRRAGVLKNKHVPQAYLRGSIEQRIALLQGLCDTDGYGTKKGSVDFTTTSPALRDGVVELVASLGIKPSVTEGIAKLYGREISPKWRIEFYAPFPSFRLKRKLARQKRDGFRGTQGTRYIVAARRVEPTPMRCIAVDAPSRTYLVGRRMVVTHNSWALLLDAASRIQEPTYRALLLRRTYPELESTLIEKSHELYPALGGSYDLQQHVWTFPKGGKIRFGFLKNRGDVERYKGPEYQYIGWDELTTFGAAANYEFLFSRLRSRVGLHCYMRGATNPGGPGHSWVLRRFGPWLYPKGSDDYDGPLTEAGTRPHAKFGQVLWIRREEGGREVVTSKGWWYPKCRNPKGACRPGQACNIHRPRSRTYIRSLVSDNPIYAGGEYEAELYNLPPLERARLLYGDWMARSSAGMYFRREWFVNETRRLLDVAPTDVVARVRYWDRAATEPSESSPDPDWTVGVLMSILRDGTFVVEDVIRERLSPGSVKALIVAQAALDPQGTIVGLEVDPAAAGKFEVMEYLRALAGYDVRCIAPWGPKETRARPVSVQAQAGNIRLVRGVWLNPYLSVLENFGEPTGHDDDVDATSGALRILTAAKLEEGRPKGGGVRTITASAPGDDDDDEDDD